MIGLFLMARDRSSGGRTIVCTTSMIGDAVRTIVGDVYTVKTLMGAGIDPHLYRAKESDVYALAGAALIFYNGLHLEGRMADIFEHLASRKKTVAVASKISPDLLLSSEFPGICDPHIWHDVSLWIQVVEHIADVLIEHDHDNALLFKQNADAYIEKLTQLNIWVKNQIQKIPVEYRKLVTAHDAFSYFGKAYGMQVVGLQGISTESQVSTKDIQHITDYLIEHKIPALFLEASIPERSVKAVQRAVESRGHIVAIVPELFSDALGDSSTTANTYYGMIQHNVMVIVSSLAPNK
jgi:ABC-type metal ion transport system, periplasmic component/surface adhesin